MNYKDIDSFYSKGDLVQVIFDDNSIMGIIEDIRETSLYMSFFKPEHKVLINTFGPPPDGAESILIDINAIKHIIKLRNPNV